MATSILTIIERIREQASKTVFDQNDKKTFVLHKYRIECDYLMRTAYVNAEVHPDSLDKGAEFNEGEKKYWLYTEGVPSVDHAFHLIDKKLGGSGYHINFIAFNSLLDMTAWKMAQEAAYNHVKKGGTRYAQINFAFQYDDKIGSAICRPIKIYYYIALYQDSVIFGEAMEGIIENINPKNIIS